MIILSHNAINLEKPEEQKAQDMNNTQANVKQDVVALPSKSALSEIDVVKKIKQKILKDDNSMKKIFKRKKAKGPNPLSCKKKIKKDPKANQKKNDSKK